MAFIDFLGECSGRRAVGKKCRRERKMERGKKKSYRSTINFFQLLLDLQPGAEAEERKKKIPTLILLMAFFVSKPVMWHTTQQSLVLFIGTNFFFKNFSRLSCFQFRDGHVFTALTIWSTSGIDNQTLFTSA